MPLPVSRNPANDDSLIGTFTEVLNDHLKITDDMLPARVVSYDRATNMATVQPLIQMVDTENNLHSRATNSNVPVLLLGAGSFFVSFHLPENSLGWIKASDRDLSLFRQRFTESPPNTFRFHTFEDSVFIPDVMQAQSIAAEDAQAMVIQNTEGTVRISLTGDRIKLTAPLVDINGPTTITGETMITGETTITGDATFSGAVNVSAGGMTVDLANHIHITPQGPSEGPVSPPADPPMP